MRRAIDWTAELYHRSARIDPIRSWETSVSHWDEDRIQLNYRRRRTTIHPTWPSDRDLHWSNELNWRKDAPRQTWMDFVSSWCYWIRPRTPLSMMKRNVNWNFRHRRVSFLERNSTRCFSIQISQSFFNHDIQSIILLSSSVIVSSSSWLLLLFLLQPVNHHRSARWCRWRKDRSSPTHWNLSSAVFSIDRWNAVATTKDAKHKFNIRFHRPNRTWVYRPNLHQILIISKQFGGIQPGWKQENRSIDLLVLRDSPVGSIFWIFRYLLYKRFCRSPM